MGTGQLIVEVIAVGTELLLGQIVNSNSAEIARRLAAGGFDTHYQVVVGDNMDRLVGTLRRAVERSDAVVITGGIGPTQDDLTREALCVLTGKAMTRDEGHAAWIRRRLSAQDREPAPNVFRMADLPDGAVPLENATGVAIGVGICHEGVWLYALPGVPAEMVPMLENEVLPRLRDVAGGPAALHSRVLRCWGVGESTIADLLDDLFVSENPTVAYLIKDMEVLVRLTAKAPTSEQAEELIAPLEATIRDRLGQVVFGVGDVRVEDIVVTRLRSAGWTVCTQERATRGGVGARLAVADTEDAVFAGTLVPGRGSTDSPLADVMLEVGPIGPDPEEGGRTTRPVTISVRTPASETVRQFEFGGDEERVASFATIAALHLLRISLDEVG